MVRWQEKVQNEDLWEPAGQEPVAKQILWRKWGWIGHTLRKPASSTTCQALTWNPQGKRKRGRPRNSWRRDTEAELKQQGTNWTGMARAAQNRVRWRRAVGRFLGSSFPEIHCVYCKDVKQPRKQASSCHSEILCVILHPLSSLFTTRAESHIWMACPVKLNTAEMHHSYVK